MAKPLRDELLKDTQITRTNKKIEIDYTTGQIAEDIAWAKKLSESGAFKRLDELIEQQRRDKNLEE